MTINLARSKHPQELRPRIIVFGVGGAGCNAVNNMIRSSLEGVECVVANTDAQALALCVSERKIQLGLGITQGLGAGSRPEIGRAAAEEAWEELSTQIQGGHMVFITAGMGGGTGTGAAPVVARAAREQGLLTVGVVTKPFHFEGAHRMRIAETGLKELQEVVDTLIVIPNQNLFRVANEKTTFADAFHMADQVLYSGVRGITDLMVMPGLINLDFADIRTVMSEMGKAMMGSGESEGANRAIEAAERAISNPLLDDTSMAGARGLLINISGGPDLTLFEVDEAANRVRDEVDPQANIIFGSAFDESLKGRVRVSIFATGIDRPQERMPAEPPRAVPLRAVPRPVVAHNDPVPLRPVAPPLRAHAEAVERAAPERPHVSLAPSLPPAAPAPARMAEARREACTPSAAAPAPAAAAALPAAQPASGGAPEPQPDMFSVLQETRRQPQRVVAHVDDIEPERSTPPSMRRTARAESARGDAARSPKPSIFNLWRRGRPEPGPGPSEPRLERGRGVPPPTRPARSHSIVEESRTTRAVGATAVPASAPSVAAEPARRPVEEDTLEIPAFLRRQAN